MFFRDVSDMVEFLENEFEEREQLKYVVREIAKEEVEEKRDEARHSNFLTVQGTTSFRVIIFQPGKKSFKASKRICICEKFCVEYGSCNRFEKYCPKVVSLKAPPRRPKNDEPPVSNMSSDAVEFPSRYLS